jgi:hypothetical protein
VARAVCSDPVPEVLATGRRWRRRLVVHLRCPRSAIPVGMKPRVILIPDPKRGGPPEGIVMLSLFAGPDNPDFVDLVARGVLDGDTDLDAEVAEDEIEARVRMLFPFSQETVARCPTRRPRWDDDDWLEDPPPGIGWPGEIDLRVSTRPPMYRLDRSGAAGLGLEGDLLLGWRGGDAIAAELR